ncbi:hypothetical protein EVG20_g1098, partial [Dentipellis fragilis]
LRERWEGPLVLKGVQSVGDAERAIDMGADGIVVSNHGGRQIDGAIGSFLALELIMRSQRVREAQVAGKFTVFFDSGVRSGSDVLKAVAMGAQGVFVARPIMYGLSINGEQGVEEVLRGLLADTEITLGLSGYKNLDEIWGKREEFMIKTQNVTYQTINSAQHRLLPLPFYRLPTSDGHFAKFSDFPSPDSRFTISLSIFAASDTQMSNSTITGGPRPVYFLMNPTSAQNRKRVARSPKITHADKSGRVRSVQKPERRKKELPANMTHCNLEAEAEESRNLDPKKEHEDYVPQVSERTLQWVRSQRHTNVNIEYEEHLAVFRISCSRYAVAIAFAMSSALSHELEWQVSSDSLASSLSLPSGRPSKRQRVAGDPAPTQWMEGMASPEIDMLVDNSDFLPTPPVSQDANLLSFGTNTLNGAAKANIVFAPQSNPSQADTGLGRQSTSMAAHAMAYDPARVTTRSASWPPEAKIPAFTFSAQDGAHGSQSSLAFGQQITSVHGSQGNAYADGPDFDVYVAE